MFYAPQSETKDGGALASRRKDAPPSDKGHKIHIFSMHRTNGVASVTSKFTLVTGKPQQEKMYINANRLTGLYL